MTEERLSPGAVRLLRVYARALQLLGALVLLAGVILYPPHAVGWIAAVVGIVAVAVLRVGAVSLSKFAYVTMTVVPVGGKEGVGAVSAGVVETGALEHFPNRDEMLAFVNYWKGLADAGYYTYVLNKPRFWDQDNVVFPNFHRWQAYVKAVTTTANRQSHV